MIIRPTPWFLASAGGGAVTEITVGLGSGEFDGYAGYFHPDMAGFVGAAPFGSITNPELMYAIVWDVSDPTQISPIYTRTNTKRFTFPDFANEYFDTSDGADGSGVFPTLAPLYYNESTYYMGGGSLPVTAGAKVRYIVSNSP
ncbi:MAG: hypothetical protein KF735_02200 [Chelatococcus sp.]|uniref:hypothetical protein n=1 Tax=Chelatococcus sp. TaxID=1953771 RepID=UPI0025BC2B49|nr:hypothetical protein [Chelatococcus sp.]MBX3536424.1 hypothetical protein [Chelatococcus sp.]